MDGKSNILFGISNSFFLQQINFYRTPSQNFKLVFFLYQKLGLKAVPVYRFFVKIEV